VGAPWCLRLPPCRTPRLGTRTRQASDTCHARRPPASQRTRDPTGSNKTKGANRGGKLFSSRSFPLAHPRTPPHRNPRKQSAVVAIATGNIEHASFPSSVAIHPPPPLPEVAPKPTASPVDRPGQRFAGKAGRSGRMAVSPLPTLTSTFSGPSNHRNGTLGKPKQLPRTFPDQTRRRLAGFWSSPPAMAPEDYIASISVFPGSFP
jgi:hypothetical protein